MNLEAAAVHRIKEGEIDGEELKAFFLLSDKLNAKTALFNMLARAPRTEKEVRLKLKEKGYRKESADYAINLAKDYGYLSDKNYAERFISVNSAARGAFRLKRELKEKGVSSEIITESIAGADLDEEGAATRIKDKFLAGKELSDKTKERLFRLLASRGFSYDVIKKVMATVGVDCGE